MISLLITLLILIGAILQSVLPGWPILLCLLLIIALETGKEQAVYAALLSAALNDALSPAPFGLSIPLFVAFTLSLRAIREEIFEDQIMTYVILGTLTGLLNVVYFGLLLTLFNLRPSAPSGFILRLGSGALTGLLLGPIVFLLMFRLRRLLRPQRRTIF